MEKLNSPALPYDGEPVRKAMIFAAGLGTRLRPLTDDRPKALVAVNGIPLLEIQLRRLRALGFTDVVVNVHHFADMVEAFLRGRDWGMAIHISDERDLLRDTGGGLRHAATLLEGDAPIFICNVDVLSDLDPQRLLAEHRQRGGLATLAMRARVSDRYLVFDEEMRLCGWENRKTGETKGQMPSIRHALAFSGIQIVEPAMLAHLPNQEVFSIIDVYLQLASLGLVHGWLDADSEWMDVGRPAELEAGAAILHRILPHG